MKFDQKAECEEVFRVANFTQVSYVIYSHARKSIQSGKLHPGSYVIYSHARKRIMSGKLHPGELCFI